jgi:glycosyltransferase involved in cell wall biosynthesis
MTCPVAFVAPLPPPVHGFSTICAAMLDLLRSKTPVSVFDRASRTPSGWPGKFWQAVMPWAYLVWLVKNPTANLYVALSGGMGQLMDWPYVLMGRLLGRRIFVHHHSFAYITAPSLLNRMFFASLRRHVHVVLSVRMGQELVRIYALDPAKVRVISNAAFFAALTLPVGRRYNTDAPIRLGYLSNISVEKGIVEFFAVLSELDRTGIAYTAQVAGPIAPSAQSIFSKLFAASRNTQYLGAIYGEARNEFYKSLDVLLFPTDYANEAEPLVIHEAIRSGAHVIACERGAIPDLLSNGAGLVVAKAVFIESAVSLIRTLNFDRTELQRAQRASLEQAWRTRHSAGGLLSALVDEIVDAEKGSLQTC